MADSGQIVRGLGLLGYYLFFHVFGIIINN